MSTIKLKLPELTASQSQKHLTHNEALFALDVLVQLTIIDRDLSAPPGSPTLGATYIVGAAPTGSWASKANQIAAYDGSGWIFFAPLEGWRGWLTDEDLLVVWDGTAWSALTGGGGGGLVDGDYGDIIVSGTGTAMAIDWTGVLDSQFRLQDNVDPTKVAVFQLSGLTTATTRTYTLPNASDTLAVLGATQTFTGLMTFSGTFAVSAATATIGNNTGASTVNLGTGATLAATAKTVNIGTAGVSTSTTTINIGSTVAGALGSTIINTPTVTLASTVTALNGANTNASLLRLGLGGATADATNQLSVNTPSVLFNRGSNDINVTLNKQAAGDDARFTFQTNFSTRALFGTLANDDFSLSVSPDGSSFFPALTALAASGDLVNIAVRSNTFAVRDNTDRTKAVQFNLTGISTGTTRNITMPNLSGILMLTDQTQTVSGALTFSNLAFNAAAATTVNLGTATAASTLNIGSGATLAATAKTINLGTGGVSTSTTTINIGPVAAGSLGTINMNAPTVVFGSTNTAITINGTTSLTGTATTAALLYLGLGGATADSYNRFSINTASLLLNNAGAGIDMTFNKNASGNDATMSFKTGFSARAIMGIAGSDDFTLKVSPNGSTFNDAFSVARATGVMTAGAEFVIPKVAMPTNPGADKVVLFGRSIAGRILPAFMGPAGLDSSLQPNMARNKVGYWNPQGNSTAVPGVFGFTAPTVTGFTATARNVATTNMFTRMRRLGYVTAATAAAVGQWRVAVSQYTLGNGSGLGGFHYVARFGISDAALVSDARMFMGMSVGATTPTNVEPSTIINCIGIGHGAADTTMSLYYGGSAAQTPIALGANFPINTRNVDMYELALFASPNSSTVQYEVTRLNTGHVATGTLSGTLGTQLPAITTLLAPWGYRTNNASALAVGMDVASCYIETDY